MRLRIGLNLVFLVPGETGGMETYARGLIAALAERDDVELRAFVNREAVEAGEGPWLDIPHETVPVRARNRIEWVRGEQQHLPRLASRAGCEIVHSLASTAPLRGAFTRVTTIHDLNYKLVPEAHFGARALGMRLLIPASARRSHRILVDARATSDDLQRHLGVPAGKIDVVPLGVGQEGPGGAAGMEAVTPERELRARLDLGERPILLSVSAKRPHKNLRRLLDAHASLPPDGRPVLVVPGYPTPHEAELLDRARDLGTAADVRFPSWVSRPDLEGLYAASAAFAFPSLYEGFGLPLLEAMRRGVPVACSSSSTLPEVAGDAALLFDPLDSDAIAAALRRLLGDPSLAADLAARGRRRAELFTWERTAAATVASYRRALDAST